MFDFFLLFLRWAFEKLKLYLEMLHDNAFCALGTSYLLLLLRFNITPLLYPRK